MSVILFPYSQILVQDLKRIIALFGSLTIFRPWYMEQSSLLDEFKNQKSVSVLSPPEILKPKEEFKALLSEYHNWIERNQDKSYREILKRGQDHGTNEDATWEIRDLMKKMGRDSSTHEEGRTFDRHLILHLANEIEIKRMEADKLLRALKNKKPLLEGSVEDVDPSFTPVIDLPGFAPESMLDKSHVFRIIEAWFGLFKEYLGDNDILISMDNRILDCIIEEWKARTDGGIFSEDIITKFKIPDLSHHGSEDQDETGQSYIDPGELEILKRYISGVGGDPVKNIQAIAAWAKDLRPIESHEVKNGFIDISIKHFPALPERESYKGHEILEQFSGKTVFLMEEG